MEDTGEDFWFCHGDCLVQWFKEILVCARLRALSYVKTLQGLEKLGVS